MPKAIAFRTLLFSFCVVFLATLWLAWQPVMGVSADLFLIIAALVQSIILTSPLLVLYSLEQTLQRRGYKTLYLQILMYFVCLAIVVFMVANYKLRDMPQPSTLLP